MKALVTGGAGFIGGNLVTELNKFGYKVTAFDKKSDKIQADLICGDICTFDFDQVLRDVDIVFHLAGLLGTTELFHRKIEAERVNVLGTLNLLESMRKSDVSKLVFTSKPNMWKYNVYTITKENAERWLEMYRKIYGFEIVIARPFNVYGGNEPLVEYRKAVPYFIVSALRNAPIEIFGNGEQTMDLIHTDDTVKALRICAERLPTETVEIGSSEPTRVKDLAEKIIELTGSKSQIVYKPMRKGETDVFRICANGIMVKLLGFKPEIKIEEGLIRTIKWYRNHLKEFTKIYSYEKEDYCETNSV